MGLSLIEQTGSSQGPGEESIAGGESGLCGTPHQFVYAVVDGIGWLSRQAALRRIHMPWTDRAINGVFSLAQLQAFKAELEQAAAIHKLR